MPDPYNPHTWIVSIEFKVPRKRAKPIDKVVLECGDDLIVVVNIHLGGPNPYSDVVFKFRSFYRVPEVSPYFRYLYGRDERLEKGYYGVGFGGPYISDVCDLVKNIVKKPGIYHFQIYAYLEIHVGGRLVRKVENTWTTKLVYLPKEAKPSKFTEFKVSIPQELEQGRAYEVLVKASWDKPLPLDGKFMIDFTIRDAAGREWKLGKFETNVAKGSRDVEKKFVIKIPVDIPVTDKKLHVHAVLKYL